jgi:hypothetical protein
MQFLGIDVSKASISCCILDTVPEDAQELMYTYDFKKFPANAMGIVDLFDLIGTEETIAIAEPTGTNYLKIWFNHLVKRGVEVRLVDHKTLRIFRQNLGLPNKNDNADALALAIYGITHQNKKRKFVMIRDDITLRLRQLALRLQHLNRCQSPLINRCRQYLAYEFPEAALIRSVRKEFHEEPPLLWGWLAGERKSKRYDLLFKKTIGYGGISNAVILNAKRICDIQREEYLVEIELREIYHHPRFTKYHQAFQPFGFGQRTGAIILSQIYPFEMFLKDGRPEVKISRGMNSGKPTTKYLSERRFMKMIGCVVTQEQSGDKDKYKKTGGGLAKQCLWQWVFARIEPRTRQRTPIGDQLGRMIDDRKDKGFPIKKVRAKVVNKSARLLYKALCKTLVE